MTICSTWWIIYFYQSAQYQKIEQYNYIFPTGKRTSVSFLLKVSRFLNHQVNKCLHNIPLYKNFTIWYICIYIYTQQTFVLPLNYSTGIGITCDKISCYMLSLACGCLIIENTKIFQNHVKHFWIFPLEDNCRILIVNKLSWIIQSCLLIDLFLTG